MEKMDYKKAFKNLYQPGNKPVLVEVPEMTFIVAEGCGDPNTSPLYAEALEILYGISFGIKMSKMSGAQPEGYFEYVVPPLEGLWVTDDSSYNGREITDKERFRWYAMIRQPEFVTEDVFEWAVEKLKKKKPELDFSRTSLRRFKEGLCAQIMHIGPYDDEPATVDRLNAFIEEQGYQTDITDIRLHHEIYLNDPRKTAPEKLRTVIRHPVKKAGE